MIMKSQEVKKLGSSIALVSWHYFVIHMRGQLKCSGQVFFVVKGPVADGTDAPHLEAYCATL
jgi:hypothetical protein